ncbi:hypothetical protein CFBP5499_28545 (plasmid) [Agrobacterium tumefaciens]|nr:hypothetical protein CFBP5499_28545 [Agrobacterium tumefaciens]
MPVAGRSPAPAPEFARSSGREGGKGTKTEGVHPPEAQPKGRRKAPILHEGRTGRPFFSLVRERRAASSFPQPDRWRDAIGVTVILFLARLRRASGRSKHRSAGGHFYDDRRPCAGPYCGLPCARLCRDRWK